MTNNTFFSVDRLSISFGGLMAVDNVSFDVEPGSIFSIIGPNGAGKTTIFNCISGLYKPDKGAVLFKGEDIVGLKPHEVARKGIARTFQNIRLFKNMTVLENIMIGRHTRLKSGIIGAVLHTKKTVIEEQQLINDCYKIVEKIGLTSYINELAKNLPYGAQRRLEIARALATEPFLLLLDEPAAGMGR